MAVPKIKRMIMAVKILGAAEGLRPKARILAMPPAAMIMQGPMTATRKISRRDNSRFNVSI